MLDVVPVITIKDHPRPPPPEPPKEPERRKVEPYRPDDPSLLQRYELVSYKNPE